jgi:hypothetical protein
LPHLHLTPAQLLLLLPDCQAIVLTLGLLRLLLLFARLIFEAGCVILGLLGAECLL